MDPDTGLLPTQPLVNGTGSDVSLNMGDPVPAPAHAHGRPPCNIGSQQSAFTRLLNKINTKYSSNVITEDYRYGNRTVNTNQTDEAKLNLKDSVFVPIATGTSQERLLNSDMDDSDLDNISEKLEHLGHNLEQLGQNLERLERLQEQEAGTGMSSVVNGGYVSDSSCSEREPNITQTKYMVKVTKLDGLNNGEKHKERIHLPAREPSPQGPHPSEVSYTTLHPSTSPRGSPAPRDHTHPR